MMRLRAVRPRSSSGLVMAGDHARGDLRVMGGRVELVVAEHRLDQTDIGLALQQVRRERVAQRVQR